MSYRHACTVAVAASLQKQLADVATAKASEVDQQTSLAVAVTAVRLTSEEYKMAEKPSAGGGGDDMWSELARRGGYDRMSFA